MSGGGSFNSDSEGTTTVSNTQEVITPNVEAGLRQSQHSLVPSNPDTLLRRAECAAALTAAGYPVLKTALDTMVTYGGGPPFRKFGKFALYRWGDALLWAQNRCSPARTTSSEADAQPAKLFRVRRKSETK
jgi:hypothetical protein